MDSAIHSVIREEGRCVGCVDCSKACPTKAIRVRDDLMRIDPATCIDCGECIRACRYDAVHARTSSPSDLKRFKYTVAVPSTTIYTQFGSDFTPAQVAGALVTANGFDSFYDVTWMCEMVSRAVDTYLSECGGPWPKISVTCPAIIRLILIRYPDLVPHLIPVHTPRELAAKVARRKFAAALGMPPDDIGIFYITPCSAMMQSIVAPVGLAESHFDGAFSIAALYGPILRALKVDAHGLDERFNPSGLAWAMSGGETAGMRNKNSLSVTGVHDVTSVFDTIEAGKFQNVDFIEAYVCPDGCVSGQLLVEGRYAARRTLQRMQARMKGQSAVAEEKVRSMFRDHFFDMEGEIKAPAIKPMTETLQQAIRRRQEKHRLLDQLPKKDCAACGAPDCTTLAEDVLAGEAQLTDCVFVKLKEYEAGRR